MNKIKQLRKLKHIKQKTIAQKLGVSQRTVGNWEQGLSQIKPSKAKELADIFGVDVSYLLGYAQEGVLQRSITEEVHNAILRVQSEHPGHEDCMAIREACMNLIEATLEGY